jgi:hypothetical protein
MEKGAGRTSIPTVLAPSSRRRSSPTVVPAVPHRSRRGILASTASPLALVPVAVRAGSCPISVDRRRTLPSSARKV